MYKLRPEDFKTEADVSKLIKYLEESPLNKQPLPDAGSKIGGYYRRLSRKPHEGVSAFLIREDKLHDDMTRALQRLLREKELSFEDYDVDLEELRKFCGFQAGQSLYHGEPVGTDHDLDHLDPDEAFPAETDEDRTETPRASQGKPFSTTSRSSKGTGKSKSKRTTSSTSSSTSHGDDVKRGKDLLERLMEKGLMPLAALDVIRGWLVLEKAVSSEEDRRLIKAATRNRLAYSEIRTALLGLFEAGGGHGGHRQSHMHRAYYQDYEAEETFDQNAEHEGYYAYEPYGQDSTYEDYGEWPDEDKLFEASEWENGEEFDEELLRLQQEQEEREKHKSELEAMLGETDRNLIEARKAVAAAHKDRGWSGTVQQKQPRSTSTYPWKGKSKGKNKTFGPPRPVPHEGSLDARWQEWKGPILLWKLWWLQGQKQERKRQGLIWFQLQHGHDGSC